MNIYLYIDKSTYRYTIRVGELPCGTPCTPHNYRATSSTWLGQLNSMLNANNEHKNITHNNYTYTAHINVSIYTYTKWPVPEGVFQASVIMMREKYYFK